MIVKNNEMLVKVKKAKGEKETRMNPNLPYPSRNLPFLDQGRLRALHEFGIHGRDNL
jgi:hypothetical protein